MTLCLGGHGKEIKWASDGEDWELLRGICTLDTNCVDQYIKHTYFTSGRHGHFIKDFQLYEESFFCFVRGKKSRNKLYPVAQTYDRNEKYKRS